MRTLLAALTALMLFAAPVVAGDLKDARAAALAWIDRCAVAELIAGNLKTHVFYLVPTSRSDTALATPDSLKAIPLWRADQSPALAQRTDKSRSLKVDFDRLPFSFGLPEGAGQFASMVDGIRPLGRIQDMLGLDWITFKARFDRLYRVLNGLNLLLLRRGP